MKQTLSHVDYMNFFFFFLKYPFPRKSLVKDENFMRIEKRPDEEYRNRGLLLTILFF